ncbi:hypothetical protein MTAT_14030 [Moorella thermoacetica]|uniref:Uncharacterized protein n=1 Tax=Neomoorella thermoacetica TaxID=1525 RepID=A0AAC9MTP7_NEOTH|nr:hypothetical protein [Moorella thermoacetica]AOQ23818.1 hypothetical protein Maut_01370 [Moorella thermoacetica]TYL14003.1 hypothetical protein MTAT_14030 [Moorella thermoacetica]
MVIEVCNVHDDLMEQLYHDKDAGVVLRSLAYAELRRLRFLAPTTLCGNCLEGIGLKDGQQILVQFGDFDYQPGDIVLFEDLEGHVMLKEFDHWLADEIAVLRTRYLDPTKDFEVITIKPFMYGKVLR